MPSDHVTRILTLIVRELGAAACNTSDKDVNRVQAHCEASKVNVITCLPNGEERSVSFLKDEELVTAMARELGAP